MVADMCCFIDFFLKLTSTYGTSSITTAILIINLKA